MAQAGHPASLELLRRYSEAKEQYMNTMDQIGKEVHDRLEQNHGCISAEDVEDFEKCKRRIAKSSRKFDLEGTSKGEYAKAVNAVATATLYSRNKEAHQHRNLSDKIAHIAKKQSHKNKEALGLPVSDMSSDSENDEELINIAKGTASGLIDLLDHEENDINNSRIFSSMRTIIPVLNDCYESSDQAGVVRNNRQRTFWLSNFSISSLKVWCLTKFLGFFIPKLPNFAGELENRTVVDSSEDSNNDIFSGIARMTTMAWFNCMGGLLANIYALPLQLLMLVTGILVNFEVHIPVLLQVETAFPVLLCVYCCIILYLWHIRTATPWRYQLVVVLSVFFLAVSEKPSLCYFAFARPSWHIFIYNLVFSLYYKLTSRLASKVFDVELTGRNVSVFAIMHSLLFHICFALLHSDDIAYVFKFHAVLFCMRLLGIWLLQVVMLQYLSSKCPYHGKEPQGVALFESSGFIADFGHVLLKIGTSTYELVVTHGGTPVCKLYRKNVHFPWWRNFYVPFYNYGLVLLVTDFSEKVADKLVKEVLRSHRKSIVHYSILGKSCQEFAFQLMYELFCDQGTKHAVDPLNIAYFAPVALNDFKTVLLIYVSYVPFIVLLLYLRTDITWT